MLPTIISAWTGCGWRLRWAVAEPIPARPTADPRIMDHYSLHVVFSGRMRWRTLIGEVVLGPGETVILPPCRLRERTGLEPGHYASAGFHAVVGPDGIDPLSRFSLHAAVAMAEPMSDLAKEWLLVTGCRPQFPGAEIGALVNARQALERLLLAYITRGMVSGSITELAALPSPGILAARMHLAQNFARPECDVAALRRIAGLGRSRFSQAFTACYGQAPETMIRSMRLANAERLVRSEPGMQVSEIAEKCGFRSPSAFTRAFRAAFGRTPREQRRRSG
ncbi:hypothetical protein LBMAG53_07710 [Planctomycetota bacterium]|nr:hypothetical protein LBMAG53_07710 [Planctomycetota bacterium]